MKRSVAIIGIQPSAEQVQTLVDALSAQEVSTRLCPASDNRAVLRWTMNLAPEQVGVAVFVDPDGQLTPLNVAALDPAIVAVCWTRMDKGTAPEKLLESPVLFSFARDTESLAQLIHPWLNETEALSPEPAIEAPVEPIDVPPADEHSNGQRTNGTSTHHHPEPTARTPVHTENEDLSHRRQSMGTPVIEAIDHNTPAELDEPAAATEEQTTDTSIDTTQPLDQALIADHLPEDIDEPPASTPPPADSTPQPAPAYEAHDAHDFATLEKLEAMMASALKEKSTAPEEPVQVQPPALDFSLALRKLMTAGRTFAHKNSHAEVLGAHYLTELEDPWREVLDGYGLSARVAADYLATLEGGTEATGDPIISDEVFAAVSVAKEKARELQHSCVRVSDFLYGLLSVRSGSITDLLDTILAQRHEIAEAVGKIDPGAEPCGEPFFKPSSMDQAGFYEFDAAEVRNLTERLRELPAFQKAAERVAESRARQEEERKPGVHITAQSDTIAPAQPPAQPEIMRVNGEFPPVDTVENIADLLLDGQLIAFPNDVMLALAADASNPIAVENLRRTANLPPDRPVSILINSVSQLKHLVRDDVDRLEPLFDEFWPGPLTLIFQNSGGAGRHISSDATIAVRQPADNISLSILSMLGRPLAVTSWDKDVASLSGHVAAIVQSEQSPVSLRTTIVDLSTRPWEIVREGIIPGQAVLRYFQARQ